MGNENNYYLVPGSELNDIGDAIREKVETTTEYAVDEMAAAIKGISTGVKLPDLTNPAASGDILSGKEAIDEEGNKITGTMPKHTYKDITGEDGDFRFPAGYYEGIDGPYGAGITWNDTRTNAMAGNFWRNTAAGTVYGPMLTEGANVERITILDRYHDAAEITPQGNTATYIGAEATVEEPVVVTEPITIKNDDTLVSDNIKSGVEINGVIGTYVGGTVCDHTFTTLTVDKAGTFNASSSGKSGYTSVTVPSGSVKTPTDAISGTGSITFDSTSKKIKATFSGSKNITPSVTEGYIESGTPGTVTASGSAEIAPSTLDSDLTAENIKAGVTIFGVEGTLEPTVDCDHTFDTFTVDRPGKFTAPEGTVYDTVEVPAGEVTPYVDHQGPDSSDYDKYYLKVYASASEPGYVSGTCGEADILLNRYNPSGYNYDDDVSITPTTSSQTIIDGSVYNPVVVDRRITVAGDADLKAENIKSGVNIFGVTGTYLGNYCKVTKLSIEATGGATVPYVMSMSFEYNQTNKIFEHEYGVVYGFNVNVLGKHDANQVDLDVIVEEAVADAVYIGYRGNTSMFDVTMSFGDSYQNIDINMPIPTPTYNRIMSIVGNNYSKVGNIYNITNPGAVCSVIKTFDIVKDASTGPSDVYSTYTWST